MGRPRKPAEEHLRAGTFRKDRHGMPLLLAGRKAPKPPASLSAAEKRVFLELVAQAGAILDSVDGLLVESASVLLVQAREIRKDISKRGLLVENRFGALVANPSVKVERDTLGELRLVLQQLGMSPAARARLGAQGVEGRSAVDTLPGLASAAKLRILVGGKDSPA